MIASPSCAETERENRHVINKDMENLFIVFGLLLEDTQFFFALRKVKRKYVIICPFCVTLSKHYPLFL